MTIHIIADLRLIKLENRPENTLIYVMWITKKYESEILMPDMLIDEKSIMGYGYNTKA